MWASCTYTQVDIEGYEHAALLGVEDEHWPMIKRYGGGWLAAGSTRYFLFKIEV